MEVVQDDSWSFVVEEITLLLPQNTFKSCGN